MIFFTADLHFGHKNIIRYCDRPFKDVAQMNSTLIKNYNEVVRPDDTCYILGDLAMGINSLELTKYIRRMNGRKILILGNHDKLHPNEY